MSAIAITGSVTAVEEERSMASGLQIALNAALERQLKQLSLEFGMRIIEAIAKEYELDAKEISEKIGFDDISVARVKTSRKASTKTGGATKGKTGGWNKPNIILPWTGERLNHPDFCLGIRKNYGLFSQCVMKRVGDGKYCTTCQKQADKNPSGKPTAGDVEDRDEQGLCEKYTPPGSEKAVKVEGYANIIQNIIKKNEDKAPLYEKEAVIEVATNFGITIDDSHFVPVAKKRAGRPKKSDSEDEENETMVEKANKKAAEIAEEAKMDEAIADEASDMLDEMIAEEEAKSAATKIAETAGYDEEEAVDAEAIEALVSDESDAEAETKKSKKSSKSKSEKKSKKVEKPKKFKYAGKEETLSGKAYADGKIVVTVDGEAVDLADMNFTFRDGDLYDENDKKVKKGKSIDAIVTNIREQMKDDDDEEEE